MEKAKLKKIIDHLPQGRVLVVGDLAIDEMLFGATSRLSREAPVIILEHQRTDIILGAAANAAHNIAKLGAYCAAIGVAGNDYYANDLQQALTDNGINATLVNDPFRSTTTKTRISGIAHQSITQQMLRIDRGHKTIVSGTVEQQLLVDILESAAHVDAILVSDYCLGVLSPAVIACCQDMARQHRLLLIVDSQGALNRFQGAHVITPNQIEAEQNLGFKLDDPAALAQGGQKLLHNCQANHVLITLGSAGMALFSQDGSMLPIPVFNHSQIFDVTGAGDTVAAILTLALATGASIAEAALLGNLAAGIVVKRFGAATTNIQELTEALDNLSEYELSSWFPRPSVEMHT